MNLGPHGAFIWASYGIVMLVIGALIGWLVLDGRRQRNLLNEVEAEAGRRRGDKESAR